MKCVNCKKTMDSEARFCDFCGYDMGEPDSPERQQGIKNNRIKLITWCVGGLVAFVAVTVAVVVLFLQPPTVVVAKALMNTADSIQSECDDMTEELPILTHLMELYKQESQTSISLAESGVLLDATVMANFDQQKYAGDFDVNIDGVQLAGTYQSTRELLTAQLAGDDTSYGLDLVNLKEDLENFQLLDLSEAAQYYNYTPVEKQDTTEELADLKEFVEELVEEIVPCMNAEKMGKQNLSIDGITVETMGYEILWDYEKFGQSLRDAGAELIDDPVHYASLVQMMDGLQQLAKVAMPTTAEEMKAAWNDDVDAIITEMEAHHFVVYLYDGRVVLCGGLDETYEQGWGVALSAGDKVLDYMAMVTVDNMNLEEMGTVSVTMEGGVFQYILDMPYGDDLSVGYYPDITTENLDIQIGADQLVLNVDTSVENTLTMSTQWDTGSWWVSNTLGIAEENWFQQDEDYLNLLTMSVMEYLGLAAQLGLF